LQASFTLAVSYPCTHTHTHKMPNTALTSSFSRFPVLGCAPSAEVLETWNTREAELISTHTHLNRDVAKPPEPQNAHAGSATGSVKEKIAKEGARTIPGRPEHGGNCDIKNLSRGSKVFLPVHVKGAKFSVGDLHFSQVSLHTAIQKSLYVALKLTSIFPPARATARYPSVAQSRWQAS
jgi:acetamidase/formamidase